MSTNGLAATSATERPVQVGFSGMPAGANGPAGNAASLFLFLVAQTLTIAARPVARKPNDGGGNGR